MIQIVELVRSVIPLMLNEVYEINLFEVYACAELDCVAQFFIIIIYDLDNITLQPKKKTSK